MRRANHHRDVALRAKTAAPPAGTLSSLAVAEAPVGNKLLPIGEAIARSRSKDSGDVDARHRAREIAIQQRIESRLPGRVRNLLVRSFDNLVILEGQCATYYTKQLAQHAAMGILDDEQLENAIAVSVPR